MTDSEHRSDRDGGPGNPRDRDDRDDRDESSATVGHHGLDALVQAEVPPATRSVRKIALRIVFIVVALGVSGWILVATFEDLDLDAIIAAARSLQDAEVIALFSMWLLWIAAQGLLTASLVSGMPVRRGVFAYVGPTGVSSIVPGPSDLPFRYGMFTSWGHSTGEATLAVAAGGIFSIGIKLVLPVVAALGLLVTGAPISGTMQTVVAVCLIVGLVIAILAIILGSERRTEWAGRIVAPIWSTVLRMLRKPQPDDLAAQLVDTRAQALGVLRDRWLLASWGTMLTAATKFALLLMALRFTGTSDDALPWPQVFVVFALVQGLTVIPITAGESGVSEIAYIGLLTAAAGEQYVNQITAAVLIFRVLTWLLIIPVGLATLGFWKLHVARHPHDQAATNPM